jgi:uncharacterized protein (DUF1501 family)
MSTTKAIDPHACDEYNGLTRRSFIGRSTAAAIALTSPAWLPRVTYAQADNSARDVIVCVFLRGGMDGLSVVVPFGDPAYYTLRPTIALPRPDSSATIKATNLDGFFGLPPGMTALVPAYNAGNVLFVQATGSIDPTRSHFDAQHFMEVGLPGNASLASGWLGRHLATRAPQKPSASLRALTFSFGMTDMLAGAPLTLPIPDPANFALAGNSASRAQRLAWLRRTYDLEADPLKTASANTDRTISTLSALNINAYVPSGGAVYPTASFGRALRSTAALIRADIGVEAVQIDLGGWDTHNAQNPLSGSMHNTMRGLADALAAFHADMDGANQLHRVTVVAMSEFGRTARENGSQGTDHGHGNCMIVMGGNVNGGRVLSQWPGLDAANLYQGQDLNVTIDHRDLLAEIVERRLGNTRVADVFPNFTPTVRDALRTGHR